MAQLNVQLTDSATVAIAYDTRLVKFIETVVRYNHGSFRSSSPTLSNIVQRAAETLSAKIMNFGTRPIVSSKRMI